MFATTAEREELGMLMEEEQPAAPAPSAWRRRAVLGATMSAAVGALTLAAMRHTSSSAALQRADETGIMAADQDIYDLSMYPTPAPAPAGGGGYGGYGGGGVDMSMYPTPAPAPAGFPAAQQLQPPPPPATPAPAPSTTPAPVEVDCSWEGENCVHSSCCRRDGMSCWEKMKDVWASCQKTCADLSKWDDDDWTCTNLGGSKGKHQVGQATSPPASVSLFCFMVVTPEGVVPPGVEPGYEQQLVQAMQDASASAFACDAHAVYEGLRVDVGEWKSIKNTDIFIKVWKDVKAGGLWEQNDWTVKVDADAVFFPERLKMHIKGIMPPSEGVYFHNINFKFHFMGALEVMNKAAVRTLLNNADACLDHIGNNGGEDIFTMECLDAVGVGYMEDFALLDDKYSSPDAFNLYDVDRCDNDATVAYHPYKAVNAWMGCYKVAMKINKPGDFTSCEHRWEGEACSLSSTNDHPGHINPGTGIVIGD